MEIGCARSEQIGFRQNQPCSDFLKPNCGAVSKRCLQTVAHGKQPTVTIAMNRVYIIIYAYKTKTFERVYSNITYVLPNVSITHSASTHTHTLTHDDIL